MRSPARAGGGGSRKQLLALSAAVLLGLTDAYCEARCSSNGLCRRSDSTCECFQGFTGGDCSKKLCKCARLTLRALAVSCQRQQRRLASAGRRGPPLTPLHDANIPPRLHTCTDPKALLAGHGSISRRKMTRRTRWTCRAATWASATWTLGRASAAPASGAWRASGSTARTGALRTGAA